MPTYEYRCRDCGEHLEAVQSFSDDPLTECPACGGNLKKVFHPVGIAFKGSGFYKTDSRSPKGSSSGSSSSGDKDSSSGDSSDTKSDSSTGDKASPGDTSSGKDKAASPAKDTSSGNGSSSGGDAKSTSKAPAST